MKCPTCQGHPADRLPLQPDDAPVLVPAPDGWCPHPCHAAAREVVDLVAKECEQYGNLLNVSKDRCAAVRALLEEVKDAE